MLRPVAPFIDYALNYDYISKVLCINKDKPKTKCNGKCYLMQELEQQQKEDITSLQILFEEYPIGFVELGSLQDAGATINQSKQIFFYQNKYSYLLNSYIFKPPISLYL